MDEFHADSRLLPLRCPRGSARACTSHLERTTVSVLCGARALRTREPLKFHTTMAQFLDAVPSSCGAGHKLCKSTSRVPATGQRMRIREEKGQRDRYSKWTRLARPLQLANDTASSGDYYNTLTMNITHCCIRRHSHNFKRRIPLKTTRLNSTASTPILSPLLSGGYLSLALAGEKQRRLATFPRSLITSPLSLH